jgi:hypothetical protein
VAVQLVIQGVEEKQIRTLIDEAGAEKTGDAKKYVRSAEDTESAPDASFAPLIVIPAVLAVGSIAKVLNRLWLERNYSGFVIDLRNPEVILKEASSIARNHVVIIDDKSVREVSVDDGEQLRALLEKLIAVRK